MGTDMDIVIAIAMVIVMAEGDTTVTLILRIMTTLS